MIFSHINFQELSPLQTVQAVYVLLLERPIDATGVTSWTAQIETGGFSRYKLLDSLVRSREFIVVHDSIGRVERLRRTKAVLDLLKIEQATPMQVAEMVYRLVLNRNIDPLGVDKCQQRIAKGSFSAWDLMLRIFKSRVYWRAYQRPTPSKRLHNARMTWVGQIPAAQRILDIGGSSPAVPEGALIELGYAHRPEKLIIFDKPPAEQYWGTPGYSQDNERTFPWGKVQYIHGYAEDILQNTELSTQKFDMIFMGQVVEHIYEDKLLAVLSWIRDHLTEQGAFFFDTPNRLLTRYETGDDNYIDPDHKKEYTPSEFAALLKVAGFTAIESWGILEMPHVIENQHIDVKDFYDGELLTPNPGNAYCFAMSGRR